MKKRVYVDVEVNFDDLLREMYLKLVECESDGERHINSGFVVDRATKILAKIPDELIALYKKDPIGTAIVIERLETELQRWKKLTSQ